MAAARKMKFPHGLNLAPGQLVAQTSYIGTYQGTDDPGGVAYEIDAFEDPSGAPIAFSTINAWAVELMADYQTLHMGDAVVQTSSVQLGGNGNSLRVYFNIRNRNGFGVWASPLPVGLMLIGLVR